MQETKCLRNYIYLEIWHVKYPYIFNAMEIVFKLKQMHTDPMRSQADFRNDIVGIYRLNELK